MGEGPSDCDAVRQTRLGQPRYATVGRGTERHHSRPITTLVAAGPLTGNARPPSVCACIAERTALADRNPRRRRRRRRLHGNARAVPSFFPRGSLLDDGSMLAAVVRVPSRLTNRPFSSCCRSPSCPGRGCANGTGSGHRSVLGVMVTSKVAAAAVQCQANEKEKEMSTLPADKLIREGRRPWRAAPSFAWPRLWR